MGVFTRISSWISGKDEKFGLSESEQTERSPLLQSGHTRVETTIERTTVERTTTEDCVEHQVGDDDTPLPDHPVSWQHEVKVMVSYAAPLIVTFFLQYSIDVASVAAAGRFGKVELGAVSLANMSATITCFGVFQGSATSLDTLCPQAYGSGKKTLVGLYCQRMVMYLMCLAVPIAVLWFFSEPIIVHLVADPETARLCSLYLRILIFALPGLAAFEVGKRFLQAQGLFRATTYVLLIASPIHATLLWLFIWKLNLGFIGAPIAVVITRTLLPTLIVLYSVLVDGTQCWEGLSKRAFSNWGPMIKLALPGMIMIEAEWLCFEILTLLSSRFGVDYLAAQSVLIMVANLSYQIPFPLSVAASTRIARLIGAGRPDDGKVAAKVAIVTSFLISLVNGSIYIAFRHQIPHLFTYDNDVAVLVVKTLPVLAAMTICDGASVAAHGILRGIGKQKIGGPATLFAYYGISMPLALTLGFGLNLKIVGLWVGASAGLLTVSLIEYPYIFITDWQKAVAEATARNVSA